MYEIVYMIWQNLFRMIRHPIGYKIDKVLVFDESETPKTMYEHSSTTMTIEQLKESIALDKYRIEVRYVSHGQKFRCVIQRDDNVHWPIRKKLEMKNNPKVLFAFLKYDDGRIADVTKRVAKYAGPNSDFNTSNGCMTYVSDMFPFQDLEHVKSLRIRLTDQTDYEFYMEDIVVM